MINAKHGLCGRQYTVPSTVQNMHSKVKLLVNCLDLTAASLLKCLEIFRKNK